MHGEPFDLQRFQFPAGAAFSRPKAPRRFIPQAALGHPGFPTHVCRIAAPRERLREGGDDLAAAFTKGICIRHRTALTERSDEQGRVAQQIADTTADSAIVFVQHIRRGRQAAREGESRHVRSTA